MKERLVIRKIKCLQAKELLALKRYILKFKNRDVYEKFAQVVLDEITKTDEEELIPIDKIGKALKLSDARVNSLLNELHTHLKGFVITELSIADELRKIEDGIKLLVFYNARHLDEYYLNLYDKLEKALQKYKVRDEFYYRSKLAIAQEHSIYKYRTQPEGTFLQQVSDALDIYFVWHKLTQSAVMINHSNIHSTDFQFHLLEQVVSHVKTNPYPDNPALSLWSDAYELLMNLDNVECHQRLEQAAFEQIDTLAKRDGRNLFIILANSLRRLETDQDEYYRRIFKYYTFQIEHDLLLIEGIFPPRLFDNIVTIALRVKDPDWTVNFIEENLKKLEPKVQKVERGYNIARCHFASGDFNTCLLELARIEKVKFNDIHLNLARRRLTIQAYFEVEHTDTEYSVNQPDRAISALKKFLHKNKEALSPEHERANLDFARFVNRLCEANSDKKIQKLGEEVTATRLLPCKTWLMQKVMNTVSS